MEKKNKSPRKLVLVKGSSSSSRHHEDEEQIIYTNTTIKDGERWREVAFRMGVFEPALYLTKPVTKTDASKDQNRYEVSLDEIQRSMQLMELAIRANASKVHVMALDKKGRQYRLDFKFIPSNCRYRFLGPDWGRFMKDNELEAGQTMRIWGLSDGKGGDFGLAFINSETKMKIKIKIGCL